MVCQESVERWGGCHRCRAWLSLLGCVANGRSLHNSSTLTSYTEEFDARQPRPTTRDAVNSRDTVWRKGRSRSVEHLFRFAQGRENFIERERLVEKHLPHRFVVGTQIR